MSRSRNWCFTWNNPSGTLALPDSASYLVYGKEVGANGTPHFQGFIHMRQAMTLGGLKKILPGAHLEIMRGTHDQAIDYCKKDGDWLEFGEKPLQGKRNDLETAIKMIKGGTDLRTVADECSSAWTRYGKGLKDLALMLQDPYEHDDVRGTWIMGPPGSGKSRYARTLSDNPYLKAQNKWWDGYNGEDTVILDDLDRGGECLGHLLKIWTDRYACTGETKGGTINLRHKKFIVTSNYSIDALFPEDEMNRAIKRRFVVLDFNHAIVRSMLLSNLAD